MVTQPNLLENNLLEKGWAKTTRKFIGVRKVDNWLCFGPTFS